MTERHGLTVQKVAEQQNMSNNTVIEYKRIFRRFGEWVGECNIELEL